MHTRYAPVRHSQQYCYCLPFDLHVLGLPLAFILSQDQTLHCNLVMKLASHRSFQRFVSGPLVFCLILRNDVLNLVVLIFPSLLHRTLFCPSYYYPPVSQTSQSYFFTRLPFVYFVFIPEWECTYFRKYFAFFICVKRKELVE